MGETIGVAESLRGEAAREASGGRAGRAYRSFFEGYEVRCVPKRRGVRVEREYVGAHYRQELPRRAMVMLRVAYAALVGCATALFATASLAPGEWNSEWCVALPQALSLPLLAWSIVSLLHCLPMADMTIANFRRGPGRLKKACGGAAAILFLDAAAVLAFVAAHGFRDPLLAAACAVMYSLGGSMMFAISRIEGGIRYAEIAREGGGEDGPGEAIAQVSGLGSQEYGKK